MACEKLVKARLCGGGTDSSRLQASHAYISKSLPIVLRQQAVFVNFRGGKAEAVLSHADYLAQVIELLAPAVKRGGQRPDNCEYPWEQGGNLYVPATWTFPALNLLEAQGGRALLKLIYNAILRLEA